jgi:hypothetical protein
MLLALVPHAIIEVVEHARASIGAAVIPVLVQVRVHMSYKKK